MKIEEMFGDVVDFKMERRKLYPLIGMIGLALCGTLSGAEIFEEIAFFWRGKM